MNQRPAFLSKLLTTLALLILSGPVFCQTDDSLFNRLNRSWDRYGEYRRAPVVFLHLDKSVYKHSEFIQFMAYQLNWRQDTSLHTLYVFLTDLANKKVGTFDRFALYEGLAAGVLPLPDSLKAGKYLVIAYTDDKLRGRSQPLFRQPITLLPDFFPPFTISQTPDSTNLKLKVTTDYQGLASGGALHYRLQADGRLIDSGDKKIDAFGEVDLGPVNRTGDAQNIQLAISVKRDKSTADTWLPLVAHPAEWRVHFYPEGGDLVSGKPGRIGVEVRDATGLPVKAKGILLADDQPLSVFGTDENGWAAPMGMFFTGNHYSIAFPEAPKEVTIKQSFPPVQPKGYVLQVSNGIARNGDSLTVMIYLPDSNRTTRLLIYNDEEIAYQSILQAKSNAFYMNIPVKDWPSGLLTMTLIDEQGLPVAERKIYSPPAHRLKVTIEPDSAIYHTRSKVSLKIHVTNEEGEGVQSIFSLSSVLDNRIRPSDDLDIVRYAAVDQYLPGGPVYGTAPFYGLPAGNWEEDSVMNLLLLIRGWTRYHWQEVAADLPPLLPRSSVVDYGYILFNDKRPKAPVSMIVFNGGVAPFLTDSAGHFEIPARFIMTAKRGDMAVTVAGGQRQDQYSLFLFNKYDSLNRAIAGAWYVPPPLPPEEVTAEEKEKENILSRTLQKVVVTPHGGGSGGIPGCRDYVCSYGILNCPNHPFGSPPVIGQSYMVRGSFGMDRVVYRGCTTDLFPSYLHNLKPVYFLREAYKEDTTATLPSGPALFTTLHWSPFVLTDNEGHATIPFYTNDLIGRFWNIIEGICPAGVLSGRKSFEVIQNLP